MRIIKPRAMGVLKRLVDEGGRYYCCFCVLGFFCLPRSRVVDTEQNMWAVVPGVLGQMPLEECLPKVRGEVLVVGECVAPGAVAAAQVEVGLRMGAVDKTLVVSGRRVWQRQRDRFSRMVGRGWVASEPERFVTMPLDWAHAFGGEGFERNPLGKGYVPQDSGVEPEGVELANVEYPGQMVADPLAVPEPGSFWPIPAHWPQRAGLLGAVERGDVRRRMPSLPSGTDPGIYNLAPVDQQIQGVWEGDEEFELVGMSPGGAVRGRLPGLRVRSFLELEGGRWEELGMGLDTVWFFPQLERMVCVWRGVRELESWNGAEVGWWVVGAEWMDGASRSPQDYAEALARRKRRGSLWRLREDDLLPAEGMESAEAPPVFSRPPPRPRRWAELLAARVGRAEGGAREAYERASGWLEQVGRQLERLKARGVRVQELPGLPPLPSSVPPVPEVPPPPEVGSPADLAAVGEYLEKVIPGLRARARQEIAGLGQVPSEAELKARAEQLRSQVMERFEQAVGRTGMREKMLGVMKDSEQQAKGFVSRAGEEIGRRLEGLVSRLPKGHPAGERLQQLRSELERIQRLSRLPRPEPPSRPRPSTAWGMHLLSRGEPVGEQEAAGALERAGRGESLQDQRLAGAQLRGCNLAGVDLRGADLSDADLTGADLSGADLAGACLARARLAGARLSGADLTGACLGRAAAAGADFSGARLVKSDLWEAELEGADLTGAVVEGVLAKATRLAGARMARVRVKGGVWVGVDMRGVKARGSSWEKVVVSDSRLEQADFSGAHLVKFTLAKVEAAGVDFSGARVEGLRAVMGSNLAGAKFVGARCSEVCMHGVQLAGADLSEAFMDRAELGEAGMRRVRAWRTSLRGALMVGADLGEARFIGANLMGAQMMYARVEGAEMVCCNLYGANLVRVEMERARVEGCLVGRSLLEGRGEHGQA